MRGSCWRIWVVSSVALALGFFYSARDSRLFAAAGAPPNIILILADDMGFSDIEPYGGEIETPALGYLAKKGLRFTQFYNAARCCPTRASLLTGLYPHEAGMGWMAGADWNHPGYRGDLNHSGVTIAEALKPAGYSSYMVGKWHLTGQLGDWGPPADPRMTSRHNWPLQRGFDRYYGIISGAGSYFSPRTLVEGNDLITPDPKEYYFTDTITDHAIRYIKEHTGSQPDKPFFLYVAYSAPHFPLHALPEDIAKYKGRYDRGWDIVRAERYQRMLEMGLLDLKWHLPPRDEMVLPWEDVEHKAWQARRMEVYAAQIDRMDQGIGRIIEVLRTSKKPPNTLIFFLSDNGATAEEIRDYLPRQTADDRPVQYGNDPAVMPGPASTYQSYGRPWANVSNTPFRLYKRWVHEGGIATPLIVHWPNGLKVKAGSITDQPGHIVDIMATCLEVAGLRYPKTYKNREIRPLQGESLKPIFEGKQRNRGPISWEHEGNRAVRLGKWKLVSEFGGEWELYDMESDRTEIRDLARTYPDQVEQMAGMYEQWARRNNVAPWAEVNRVPESSSVTLKWGHGYVGIKPLPEE